MTEQFKLRKSLISAPFVALAMMMAAPVQAQDQPNQEQPVQKEDVGFVQEHQDQSTEMWRNAELNRLYPDIGKSEDVTLQIGSMGDLDVYMGLMTVSRFQALNQSDAYVIDRSGAQPVAVKLDDISPGLQVPFGDLEFLARHGDDFEVYFDLYLASRGHETTTYGHQGFILLRRLPGPLAPVTDPIFRFINVKAGAFEIDYGDQWMWRSNNADVQANPLIGNSVIDSETTEIGAEIFNDENRFNWLVGVGNGDTQTGFNDGKGFSAHAKLWGYPLESLRLSLSGYYADHTGDGTGYPNGGTKSRLFSGNRSGAAYSDLFAGGHESGQVAPKNGQKVLAGQFDLTGRWGPFELYANAGYTKDADTNGDAEGEPEEAWEYHTAQAVWHFNKVFYAAARYSGAFALKLNDQDSSGTVNRYQGGLGLWLTEGMLLKGEYVYQNLSGFDEADGMVAGVQAYRDPSFNGAVFEASYQF